MNNRPIRTIVIHCSDSPHRGDQAEDVHQWHLENGWSGIGYHYTIDEYGVTEAGRPEYWIGSHVRGHNKHSLGIMLFGKDFFTQAQYDALWELLKEIKSRHNKPKIVGHCELNPAKSCPNFNVQEWLQLRATWEEKYGTPF